MKTGRIISFFLILLYGIICFRVNYLKDFPTEFEQTNLDKNLYIAGLLSQDKELTLLSDETEDYNYNYVNNILHATVVADTVLRSVVYENNNYYLKASVNSNSESRVLVKLKINKPLADQLKANLYSNCVMIADISTAQDLPFSKSISDIDGNILWSSEKNDILLEGELVKLTLISSSPYEQSIS